MFRVRHSATDGRNSTILMIFWTWGRELEDSFDDVHTQKLGRILVQSEPDTTHGNGHSLPPKDEHEITAVLSRAIDGGSGASSESESEQLVPELYLRKTNGELLKLDRIPVMAIFHRNDSAGKGVPHSFASFLQRYPVLPQVVVSPPPVWGISVLSTDAGARSSCPRGWWLCRMSRSRTGT